MGQDKGLCLLAGKPLVQHVIDRVRGLGDELWITTNHPEDYAPFGIPTVSDPHPGMGALVGLRTALLAARGEAVLLVACDMPFLNLALLRYLLARAGEADVVIPRRGGEFEPLHAVYARTCREPVQSALDRGQARMISFFSDVRILPIEQSDLDRIDPDGLSFFNINTPQDLAQAERRLRPAAGGSIDGEHP